MKNKFLILKRSGIVSGAVAAALLLIVFSFFTFRAQLDSYIAEEMRFQIEAIQENSTLLIQNEMNYLKRSTAAFAQMLSSAKIQTDEDILHALRDYAETADITRVLFISLDGRAYTSYAGDLGQSEKNTSINGTHLSDITEPIFSEPYYAEDLDEVNYGVIAPATMGAKRGVLISSYNVNDFSALLKNKFVDGSADIGIVNSKGEVILGKSIDEFKYNIFDSLCHIKFEISSGETMKSDMANGKTGFSIYNVGDVSRYCSYAPIGLNDWYAIVMVKEDVLQRKLTDLEKYGFQLAIELVIIMAVLLCVIIVSWRGAQKNIRMLLEKAAKMDGLTGINNRKAIEEIIEQRLRTAGKDSCATLLAIDLDDFKQINDHLGHLFGDHVLKECANRLTRIFGEEGDVGRIGGDEFIVLLKNGRDTKKIEEKVNQLIDDFYVLTDTGGKQKISISVGIAQVEPKGDSFHSLYQKADVALYHAKQTGKSRLSH